MRRWAAIAAVLAAGVTQADPAAQAAFANCPSGAPTVDLLGRPLDWHAWRASPVLVVVWSPDCAFCQRHNEKLGRLLRETPGAAVVGLAVDSTPQAVQRAVQRRGYAFPILVDGSGPCALRPQLSTRPVVPLTCWLGEAPTAPRCIPGEMSEDDLRDLLKAQARSSRQAW